MVQYRQLQAPVELNTNVPDSGAASAYQSLAQTFKQFSNKSFDLAGQVNTAAGEQAGAAEGAAGKPKPFSGWREMTAYGKAYNSAAEATYVAKTHIDVQNTLTQIEQDTGGDLPAYQARASAYVAQLQKSTPAEYWPKLEPLINGRMVAGGIKVHGEEIKQQGEDQYDTYLKAVPARIEGVMNSYAVSNDAGDKAMAAALADNDAHLQALMTGPHPVIDATIAERRRTEFTLQMHHGLEQQHVAMIVNPAMDAAKANVEQGDAMMNQTLTDPNIPDEVKQAAMSEYRKQRELQDFTRAHANVDPLNNLAQAVAGGGYGPQLEENARQLYRTGAMPEGELQTKMAEMTRNEEKHAADRASMAAVEDALANDRGLDPKNPEMVKAVELKFQALMTQAGETPGSERWINAASVLEKHLNILPPSAESWVRVGLMSGDFKQAGLAAGAYSNFRDANPTAAMFINDPKIKALAETLNGNMAANMAPEAAYALAMHTVNLPEEQKAVLRVNYGKGNFSQNNADWLHSNVLNKSSDINPGFFNNTPPTPVALQAEFEQQVRQYYDITGGDIDKARKLAGDAVTRQGLWGRTEVNGQPEVIKYGGALPDAPILRADIAEKVKGMSVPSPEGHGTSMPLDPSTVKLVESPATGRTQGKHWQLQTVDQYGSPTPVLDPRTNRPLDYTLPSNDAAFQRKQTEVHATELANSKADRLRYLAIHPVEITNAEKASRIIGGLGPG